MHVDLPYSGNVRQGADKAMRFSLRCLVKKSTYMNGSLGCRSCWDRQIGILDAALKETGMLSKAKFLKTTILAAVVSFAALAAISPASAHDYDRDRGGYGHGDSYGDRDGRGWGGDDRGDRGGRGDRDGRGWGRGGDDDSGWRDNRDGWGGDGWGNGWRWRHRHHHHHDDDRGWY